MNAAPTPVFRDIVLVGGGHSHVGVLRAFALRPLPGVRLTVICTDTDTPYSGMLPGYVAGHYGFDDVHIDLSRLARFAGARYYRDEVVAIDRVARRVECRERPPVRYDLLSINVGSTPRLATVPGAAMHAVAVKPIRRFDERWRALLARVRGHAGPVVVAVVGAGAGGVELTLAMQYRLHNELHALGRDGDRPAFHLFSAGPAILPTHNAAVRRAFERVLTARGVVVHRDAEVVAVEAGALRTRSGETFAADEIVWVTQAGGAPWLGATGLALDANGFVRVRETLQTETDPRVFAAGDCAATAGRPLEKAGVFAVRMGRPLAENLRRSILGQPLVTYRPQRRWLALISTGDRHAIASRGALFAQGHWVWRWKDRIDRRFMRRFGEFTPMPASRRDAPDASQLRLDADEAQQATLATGMRCGGCGAKVGPASLSGALARLRPLQRADVLIGLGAADDAAVVRVPPGKAMVHTVDFFRAFIDDPWLFGRISANHALGDVYAMGAEAQSATAIVTVPPGPEREVEDVVFQLMKGAVEVLNEVGCALVGGHTGEGSELALGFAVNGLVDEGLEGILRKDGLQPGQALILTKPLGTGTLLAAHARLAARGRWIDAALTSMQVDGRAAARCLVAHGATACTDVTGFGLVGHLAEMTRAAGTDAEIKLAALPLLDGAAETAGAGFLSSLQPANLRLATAIRNRETALAHPLAALLFDPQTAGGLLAGVPEDNADACVAALRASGYERAARIGRVLSRGAAPEPITVVP